jgi:starvation-inducible outer membrane lipoprotein
MMKPLLTILTVLLLSACATAPAPSREQTQAPAQQYPAWLEMKPGYAETCMKGGGCVPMTQAELQELADEVVQRTLQACRRATNI